MKEPVPMASSVMMFNSPGTVWTVTGAQFMAAARQHWSDALIADDPYAGGYHLVGVQFIVPGGMGVDAQFAVRGDGDGYFSIRSGTHLAAAEMFAWVRDLLGPENECSIVETATGTITAVPYGTSPGGLLDIIATVSP
jgi:hypothetical protein